MQLRKIITGVDDQGRSCIIEECDVTPTPVPTMPEVAVQALYRTDESPPPPIPPHNSVEVPHVLPPGHLRWSVVQHFPLPEGSEPNVSTEMHYSHTLDLFIVVAGSTTMVLDTVERELFPGDCVVMNGVDHAMVTGPNGSTLVTATLGTQPEVA